MFFLVRVAAYAVVLPLLVLQRLHTAAANDAPYDVPFQSTEAQLSEPPATTTGELPANVPPRLRLAAFVTNVTPDSPDVAAVSSYLAELAQEHLQVQRAVMDAPVADPMVNSGSVFSFILMNDGRIIVSDSQDTPDAFNGYANKWKGALEYNPDVSAPIVVISDPDNGVNGQDEHQYYLDPTRFETNVLTGDPGEDSVPSDGAATAADAYTEGLLADNWADTTPAEDLKSVLSSRYEVMQLRLVKAAVDDLLAGPAALVALVDNLRNTAATVLAALESRVLLTSLDTQNGVIQFTIHPATDAEVVGTAQKWAAAVASESAAIHDVFGSTIDYSYPAYALTGVTTTPGPENADSGVRDETSDSTGGTSSGVVAGAVAGSLCGAGAVGALGFVYRRRQMNKAAHSSQAADANRGHFSDFSPEGLSPHGLTNVDIRGELTPGAAGGGVFRG